MEVSAPLSRRKAYSSDLSAHDWQRLEPLLLAHVMAQPPDIYFFPREGPLDIAFLTLHQLGLTRSRVVFVLLADS